MAAVIPLTTIANLPLTINLPSIPSPRGLPSILDKAQRERSLSPSSAALITLLVQSYGESHTVEVSAISALALLLTCGRECAVRPLVLRFHLFPLLQGYIAANLARRAARILYSSFFDNLFESREAASRRGSLCLPRRPHPRAALQALLAAQARGRRWRPAARGVQAPPLGMAAGARRPLAARVVTRGRNALPGAAQWSREPPPLTPKKRILILISDTGGGTARRRRRWPRRSRIGTARRSRRRLSTCGPSSAPGRGQEDGAPLPLARQAADCGTRTFARRRSRR